MIKAKFYPHEHKLLLALQDCNHGDVGVENDGSAAKINRSQLSSEHEA